MIRFKILKKSALLATSLMLLSNASNAQSQLGNDIDGSAIGDSLGYSVSMPDRYTLAVGIPRHDDSGNAAGQVRIYRWDGSTWVQKGANIDGEATGDQSGSSVSMPDSNTVAIGAPYNDGAGTESGHVRIYTWDGGAWVQKGMDINGQMSYSRAGWAVSMPTPNVVAIGAPDNNGTGSRTGQVRVYIWDGTTWLLRPTFYGEAPLGLFGQSVSMPDSLTVAAGAPFNNGNGQRAGHVRVYAYNPATVVWNQRGADIDGEAAYNESGRSVSMPDANTVAIGAPRNAGSAGQSAGHVRIFTWDGSAWVQKGADINGNVLGEQLGYSVSMPDANMIAIGSPINTSSTGRVRVYMWNGSAWIQKGMDIDGEAAYDRSGTSVSMPDAITLAIGAPLNNNLGGADAGQVRVYDFSNINVIETALPNLSAYPNPTQDRLIVELGQQLDQVEVMITNALGQEVSRQQATATDQIELSINGDAGIYFVILTKQNKLLARLKVLKQ